jgi:uncharacterized membrane protein
MSDDNREDITNGQDQPLFSATLNPHRSLGPRGFTVLMLLVSAISFTAGYVFYRIGAWPVMGFCGLDVLAVYVAFRLNYRSARAFEEVEVRRHEILIRKVSARGRALEYRFNPDWVRLEIERIEDEGVTRIILYSRGRGVAVADFLNPDDRTTFADAFKASISAARAGI